MDSRIRGRAPLALGQHARGSDGQELPPVVPAKAGTHILAPVWTPACAGVADGSFPSVVPPEYFCSIRGVLSPEYFCVIRGAFLAKADPRIGRETAIMNYVLSQMGDTHHRRMDVLFDTLVVIARALNQADVHWGVGASVLLYYHGLVDAPHDIDIIISEGDADMAASILSGLGREAPGDPARSLYSTSRFLEYIVDGTDVDVMAGFAIRHDNGTYVFPFDDRSITMRKCVKGVTIPFSSLEDWYVLYQLMPGREAKVKLIEDYIRTVGIADEALLRRALSGELPADVRARIERLLASCRSSEH